MPPINLLHHEDPEIQEWFGRAQALVHLWSPLETPGFKQHISLIHQTIGGHDDGWRGMLRTINQARYDLRMRSVGPLTVLMDQGGVFNYFDHVRKVIELAKIDLLFVDPYLDAEFVSRYLPLVGDGVVIRLLGEKKLKTLLPAVELLRRQNNLSIQVRSNPDIHDRYVFVDQMSCYQSGASFKDGAKGAPTTFTQIVDAFPAVLTTYEQRWATATVI
jgi:hypothetical protein